jgi:hypothetical protein
MIYKNRFNYAPNIVNKNTKVTIKGYIKRPKSKFIFGDEGIMIIPIKFAYRPDLISRYLYGTPKYSWLLALINGFKNTPKDFESGREIIFTNPNRVK